MPYIDIVPPEQATGKLARQYEASLKRDRRIAGIIQVMSQNPDALDDLLRLYGTVAYAPSGLTRAEREMVAVVVSRANGCRY
ncbi:MAG: peroxidase [bacterium]|nr:peroxidase [bacterium]